MKPVHTLTRRDGTTLYRVDSSWLTEDVARTGCLDGCDLCAVKRFALATLCDDAICTLADAERNGYPRSRAVYMTLEDAAFTRITGTPPSSKTAKGVQPPSGEPYAYP